jgi:hypothetical protein
MNIDKVPFRETSLALANWFAIIGFLVGGGGVLLCGLTMVGAFEPPLPPNTAYCGTHALFGWFLMLIATPVTAIISSLVAWSIGLWLESIVAGHAMLPSSPLPHGV